MTIIRRPRAGLLIVAVAALLMAVSNVSVSAETPPASMPVKVTATVNGHTYDYGQSITGVSDGDVVDVHVDAQSPPNAVASSIFGIEGRECSNDAPVSNLFDFTPTQGGNCSNVALGSGSLHPIVPVAPPNATGDMSFTLGEGTTTFDDGDLVSHTITCEDGDTCKLVVQLQVPGTSVYADFPVTFGTPKTAPSAPTALHATAGNQQADVSWTAPSNDGGAAITGYTVTSSPGGKTCTTAALTCTVTGLNNFTAYTFTATATNSASLTSVASSASNSVTPLPTPPSITNANPGDAQVSVTWSAASPAPTNYTVTSSPGGKTCTTATSTCTVTGLTNGTPYTFVVTANYTGGTAVSAASAPVTPTAAPGPPSPPTAASATVGNQQATVSWTAPSNTGGSAITGYTVTSAPDGKTCTSATTSCTVTGLTNFTAYTFTVTATNAGSFTSSPSGPSNSVTPLPTPPTIASTTAGDAQVTVTWTAANPAPTTYTVTSAPGGATCTTATLTCTVSGLTNGTAYTFTVTATYGGGTVTSPSSSSVTPHGAPTPPTAVSATAGNQQATVSWTAPSNTGGAAITGYTVTSAPDGKTCTTATTSCTVTGLTNFTAYTFTVTATNSASLISGSSGPSNSVTPLPAPPTVTHVTAGDVEVTVTWSAANPAPTSYTVTSTPDGKTCTTSTLSCVVTGLTNGTAYTFMVTATYAGGTVTSAASSSVTPQAPAPPGSPTAVHATAGNGQATVSWTAPDDDGGSAITGYTVTASPGPDQQQVHALAGAHPLVAGSCTTTSTTCTVTGLDDFTPYTFTVTATNGFSLTSDPSEATTAVTPLPKAPAITSVKGGDGSVVVTWSAADPAPNGYSVAGTPGGSCTTTTATTCTISGLTDGTPYTFVVTATYDGGTVESPASTSVTPAVPTTTTTTSPTTSTTVSGSTTGATAAPTVEGTATLPVTGASDTTWLAELALLVIGMGALLIIASRRSLDRR